MIHDVTRFWDLSGEKTARFADPALAAAERTVTSGGGLLQVFVSLLFVLAAIFVVAWIVRRMRVTPRSRDGHLKVIDEVVLGNKERTVILDVEGTRLVLGLGEGRVTLLHRYTPAAGQEQVAVESAPSVVTTPSFLDVLKKGLGK